MRRWDWQAPVILALSAFAIVSAAMAALDKWPELRTIRIASLLDRVPSVSQISLPSLTGGLRVIDGDTVASGGDHYRLGRIDIHRSQIIAAARWMNPAKWADRLS